MSAHFEQLSVRKTEREREWRKWKIVTLKDDGEKKQNHDVPPSPCCNPTCANSPPLLSNRLSLLDSEVLLLSLTCWVIFLSLKFFILKKTKIFYLIFPLSFTLWFGFYYTLPLPPNTRAHTHKRTHAFAIPSPPSLKCIVCALTEFSQALTKQRIQRAPLKVPRRCLRLPADFNNAFKLFGAAWGGCVRLTNTHTHTHMPNIHSFLLTFKSQSQSLCIVFVFVFVFVSVYGCAFIIYLSSPTLKRVFGGTSAVGSVVTLSLFLCMR